MGTEREQELIAEIARWKTDYEDACCTIVKMHAAAVGEIRGPDVGPVEDIAALRAELLQLRERFKTSGEDKSPDLGHDLCEAQRKCLMPEIQRLRKWIDDLQSGMYVTCVYCGHRYGPRESTPDSMSDILKQHIEVCPDHPMSKLKMENEALKRDAVGIGYISGIKKTFAEIRRINEGNQVSESILHGMILCCDFLEKANELKDDAKIDEYLKRLVESIT